MPFAGDYTPPTSPGELQPFALDFGPQLVGGDTITGTPVVTLAAYEGVDLNAPAALFGSPTIAGTVVTQMIGGPLPGGLQPCVVYRLTITVTTNQGKTLINYAHVACAAIT